MYVLLDNIPEDTCNYLISNGFHLKKVYGSYAILYTEVNEALELINSNSLVLKR